MTDIATGEVPGEPVPVPRAPELAAETAPREAAASAEAAPQADAPAAAAELAYPNGNGSASAAVLDHFADSAESGDQSIAQIIAGLGGTVSRNTVESAVRRLHEAGRLLRTAPGTYRLAPPEAAKPAAPPQPELDQVQRDEQERLDALERDRARKRLERQRDREAALARQAEADDALRNRLVAGAYGNIMPGAGIQDIAPIKAMLVDGVPLEHILIGLMRRCDKRIDPQATPLASWREERFLESVARAVLLGGLLPQLVQGWKAAGTAPGKVTEKPEPSSATQEPPKPEDARAVPPANGATHPGDGDELGPTAAALMRKFGQADGSPSPAAAPAGDHGSVQGKADVMAAFARNRPPPQPAAPSPRPPQPQERNRLA